MAFSFCCWERLRLAQRLPASRARTSSTRMAADLALFASMAWAPRILICIDARQGFDLHSFPKRIRLDPAAAAEEEQHGENDDHHDGDDYDEGDKAAFVPDVGQADIH